MSDNVSAGRIRQLRVMRECDRILSGVRPPTTAERLARLAKYADDALDPAELPDMYGDGGAVSHLEARTAQLLGTEAALLFPTGTMAQQVALRCHAGASGSDVIGIHPLAHPLKWERDALSVVAGLRPLVLSEGPGQLTAEDVRGSGERFGTLFYELPLREHGFVLPTWDELLGVVQAARDRGAALHLDGARLWESTTGLGHGLHEIVDLFDSVYVSYYKALGAGAGAALAGSAELIEEAHAWRHRYGGRPFQAWPMALDALAALDETLPRLDTYVAHAPVIAAGLAAVPEAIVHPAVPHTHQFQVWLPYPAEEINRVRVDLAVERGVWLTGKWDEPGLPGFSFTEITVAGAALEWTAEQVTAEFGALVERLRAG
ncbi:beta-eliminating lyase-related protein [Streptomyces sp. SID3343]|uniref:threonine aldolase family protein n=1 Tax=Streptomyces sp. SID3343 TaxID=2690260 RepID=UPI00136B3F29|nr:beta-eliminating lyase-related protein [Streptomyces sp. SID3343]MYV99356.1 threonine aldolase [Streptomyces sp. SID3343]